MAQAARPEINDQTVTIHSIVKEAQMVREHFHRLAPQHGNTQLTDENTLILLLAAFFEPLTQSLRCIEHLAQVTSVKEQLDVQRVAKSTLADAMGRFRLEHLRPLVKKLADRVPHLGRRDAPLDTLAKQIIAGDGSMFRLAGEVFWAIQRTKNKQGKIDSQCRLDLLVDIERWTIEDFAVSGKESGGEAAVMGRLLKSGVLYLFDRAYYPFEFLGRILSLESDFVVRLKKDIVFRPLEPPQEPTQEPSVARPSPSPLSDKDREAGVLSDQRGHVGVEHGCKGQAPAQTLRLVTVWDAKNGQEVRLLTSLLEVEAWVIGFLYRCRWIIELFLRWLKVTAGFQHLLSTSANGITLQFYVAMIGTLLIYLRTGLPVSKYSLLALGIVARGHGRYADQLPILLQRERERMLERQRRARNKGAKRELA